MLPTFLASSLIASDCVVSCSTALISSSRETLPPQRAQSDSRFSSPRACASRSDWAARQAHALAVLERLVVFGRAAAASLVPAPLPSRPARRGNAGRRRARTAWRRRPDALPSACALPAGRSASSSSKRCCRPAASLAGGRRRQLAPFFFQGVGIERCRRRRLPAGQHRLAAGERALALFERAEAGRQARMFGGEFVDQVARQRGVFGRGQRAGVGRGHLLELRRRCSAAGKPLAASLRSAATLSMTPRCSTTWASRRCASAVRAASNCGRQFRRGDHRPAPVQFGDMVGREFFVLQQLPGLVDAGLRRAAIRTGGGGSRPAATASAWRRGGRCCGSPHAPARAGPAYGRTRPRQGAARKIRNAG